MVVSFLGFQDLATEAGIAAVDWLWAGVAVIVGFVLGTIMSQIVKRTFLRRGKRMAQLAAAASSLTFSLVVVIGLLVALGFVQPDSLEQLRDDTIEYLPRALSAIIVVILGSVIGTIVSTGVREAIGRTMGRLGDQIATVLKGGVTAFAAILAASQLGIDTTVINIFVAAVCGGAALGFALIVGLGSRPVATEIANGRALRRLIATGDTIESGTTSGQIVALHPTAIEIEHDGARALVPNSEIAEAGFRLQRGD